MEEWGLKPEHFDAVAENILATLRERGVSEDLIAEVAALAAAPQHKKAVLNQVIENPSITHQVRHIKTMILPKNYGK